MEWNLKYGYSKHPSISNEEWFIALKKEGYTGLPIDDKPDLCDELRHVWEAFFELTGSRQLSFGGAGPIPYNVISDYMNENEIYGADFRAWFRSMISVMDRTFMQAQNKGGDSGQKRKHRHSSKSRRV